MIVAVVFGQLPTRINCRDFLLLSLLTSGCLSYRYISGLQIEKDSEPAHTLCLCVCVCVGVCVGVCDCVRGCRRAWVDACVRARMRVCVHVCVRGLVHIFLACTMCGRHSIFQLAVYGSGVFFSLKT